MDSRISLKTPAKINLHLNITAKRADGYHEIETLFLPVKSLTDTVTIEPGESIEIVCAHPGVPEDSSNLCWKAADLFFKTTGLPSGVKITIEKNIPVAGGMGGGSSDAAAVFRILNHEYGQPLDDKKLNELAASIGADIPFFLNPVPSTATGIGEVLTPVEVPKEFALVIAAPAFPVSAGWAYKNLDIEANRSKVSLEEVLSNLDDYHPHNSLAAAVIKKFALVKGLLDDLSELGAISQVSGSGPTVFGICPGKEEAEAVCGKLKELYPAINIFTGQA